MSRSVSRSLWMTLVLAVAGCAQPSIPPGNRVSTTHDAGPPDAGQTVDAGQNGGSDGGDGGCDEADASCPCPTNFHRCGLLCQLDENPQFCGLSCMSCPEPQNAVATCTNSECGLTCTNGTHLCGTSCDQPGPDSCGPACTQCPGASNATAVCVTPDGGEPFCDLSCSDGFETCTVGGTSTCATSTDNPCSVNGDCCGGLCQLGTCCAHSGTPCGSASDCNVNKCSGVADMQCLNQLCCLPTGATCKNPSDCCGPDGGVGSCVSIAGFATCQ